MLLSEAIRIGAQKRPQCFGDYFDYDNASSCALGAAKEALTGEFGYDGIYTALAKLGTSNTNGVCPHCGQKEETLGSLCVHLNDDHKLTREAIADHIATLGY